MSFALSRDNGAFEWCGQRNAPLRGVFAQRRNLLSPGFLGFLREILRFQKVARAIVASGRFDGMTLGQFLERHGFGRRLRDDYALPMGAAIWSMTPQDTLGFPVESFLTFFDNHKLLQQDQPHWRTVSGGSRVYVEAIGRRLGESLRTDCRIDAIHREDGYVRLVDMNGQASVYDAAVIATAAPTALRLLANADVNERAILGAFRVSCNRAVLHRDAGHMPRRKAAWAAWNLMETTGKGVAVTYWMNRLQGLETRHPLFVTLNPLVPPAPESVLGEFSYDHPIYDAPALAAQRRLGDIQGAGKVWFAGAWTGYGFHEDGLRSGLQAAAALGFGPPWGGEVL